jgi:hypothetical protein
MTASTACPECLRRSWLLAKLAAYIARHFCSKSGAAIHDLLALPSDELARLVAPKVANQLMAQVDAIPQQCFREGIELGDCWAICRHSDDFPESLRALDDAPWTLFGRGDYELLAGRTRSTPKTRSLPRGAICTPPARPPTGTMRSLPTTMPSGTSPECSRTLVASRVSGQRRFLKAKALSHAARP